MPTSRQKAKAGEQPTSPPTSHCPECCGLSVCPGSSSPAPLDMEVGQLCRVRFCDDGMHRVRFTVIYCYI